MNSKVKKVEWLQHYDNSHKNSVWYGGDVVVISLERYEIIIGAYGDIRLWIGNEYYTDKNNGGTIGKALMENGIMDDDDLHIADGNGEIAWDNNNWFEYRIYDKVKGRYVDAYDDCVLYDDFDENDKFNWLVAEIEEAIEDYEQDN